MKGTTVVSDTCFAHSLDSRPETEWHLLADHLRHTGELAAEHAQAFGAGDMARISGLLHDLGKYSTPFQHRLRGSVSRVDHSTAGAKASKELFPGPVGTLLAHCIAGHHAGLANGRDTGERAPLLERLKADAPELLPIWKDEISLPMALPPPEHMKLKPGRQGFQLAFLCRMLFSCLVDADFIDTESFYAGAEGRSIQRGGGPSLLALGQTLNAFLATFKQDSPVNRLRAEVLDHARRQAVEAPGLFSMTVPTGGGKTLATLAFALDHARRHSMDRVIYVIPFTSVVEQTAEVFRRAFDDLGADAVLEHHSAFTDDQKMAPEARGKLRQAMENWDSPIVVTTAVQFFESLFADRPSKCRKLHNITNSVVILDEAQILPLKLLRPCVAAIDELALNYHTSVVLCTATQPALNQTEDPERSFSGGLENVRELAPDPHGLHKALKRVRVRHMGAQDDAALSQQLTDAERVLCIVNNRQHARALFQSIQSSPGAVHLTTLMCAKHRSQVLAGVKKKLDAGHPVRLIATSLIEAGVDVDFPLVLRAEAGLDSIAQAAGRCNREGLREAEESKVRVFQSPDWKPPTELEQFAQTAREVLRLHPKDPLSLAAIERYFRLLYWQRDGRDSGLDGHAILKRLEDGGVEGMPLEAVARDFRMIDNAQHPVIVPFDEDAREALRALEFVERPGAIARKLQPYVVQISRKGFDALSQAGAIQPVAQERFDSQFMQLVNPDLYDESFGLHWDNPAFISAERLTW